jgi:post-segregation antitoxin (ccd killing protein)
MQNDKHRITPVIPYDLYRSLKDNNINISIAVRHALDAYIANIPDVLPDTRLPGEQQRIILEIDMDMYAKLKAIKDTHHISISRLAWHAIDCYIKNKGGKK